MKKTPIGVIVVAVLNLLCAVGDFYFAALWVALGAMGRPPSHISVPISYWIVLYGSLLLSVVALIVSIGIFRGARRAWYLSMILWAFSAVHYCYAASLIFTGENFMIMAGLAVLANLALIAYFQSRQVREYFLDNRTS